MMTIILIIGLVILAVTVLCLSINFMKEKHYSARIAEDNEKLTIENINLSAAMHKLKNQL